MNTQEEQSKPRRAGDARQSWELAAELMAKRPHSAYAQAYRVEALLRLERVDEARPIAEGLFATGYRQSELLELCERHGIAVPESS